MGSYIINKYDQKNSHKMNIDKKYVKRIIDDVYNVIYIMIITLDMPTDSCTRICIELID